ncbi:hypothetical protein K490DRAFT_58389 [Saccharata proteae CBS 121410]|uniref:Mso1 N-terminal domain-containing protein n=1 Tax=Saccharata proteae CBS 121410 TaxID=1314787 RepID=A0A9P4LVV1_9PEZI|nr:hypothetical protein K490DRAFT_58389 [Saccharata proteae CBS 121410]
MSSYLSSLLTTTTTRYNSIRRNLLSDEVDGDTPDDSHISRVLRAYYIEKGRLFPPWLPPDPKAPAATPQQQFVSSSRPPLGSQNSNASTATSGRGLSDLWDPPQQSQQPQQPMSLRNRPGGRGNAAGGRGGMLGPQSAEQVHGRPLPSQRAGSYQSTVSLGQQSGQRGSFESGPPGSSGGGGTAQERLKARLWGSGRSASPTPSTASQPSPGASPGVGTRGNPFDSGRFNGPRPQR